MNKALILILLLTTILSTTVFAGKTYTPNQLNNMIDNGQYPEQGFASTQSESMSFSSCKTAVDNVMSQLRGIYPVKTITNTSELYIVKAWSNDGTIMVTCSDQDQKILFTQAPYL